MAEIDVSAHIKYSSSTCNLKGAGFHRDAYSGVHVIKGKRHQKREISPIPSPNHAVI